MKITFKMVIDIAQIENVEAVLSPTDNHRGPSTTGSPVSRCLGVTACVKTAHTVNHRMSSSMLELCNLVKVVE